jgi:hypothetical protein
MMNLAIVRYPRTGSAKFVYSALKPARETSGVNRSPSRAACTFALYVVIWLIPGVGIASEVLEQKFDGMCH